MDRLGTLFNSTMEYFVTLAPSVEKTRSAVAATVIIGVGLLSATISWYGQRALCLILPFIGTCRAFPNYFVLLLALSVAQVLMLGMGMAVSLGTNVHFIKATLKAACAAVVLDTLAILVAVLVAGTNKYLAFTIAYSAALVVAFALVVETLLLYIFTTKWYKDAARAMEDTVESTMGQLRLGRLPESMLRAHGRLTLYAEVDFLLTVMWFGSIVVFSFLPNSWRVMQTEVYFVVLLFTSLHVIIGTLYQAVTGHADVFEQLQLTMLVPISDSLIVVTIVIVAVDALLVFAATLMVVLQLILYEGPSAPLPVFWAMSLGIVLVLFLAVDYFALMALTTYRAGAQRWYKKNWSLFAEKLGKNASGITRLIDYRAGRRGLKSKTS